MIQHFMHNWQKHPLSLAVLLPLSLGIAFYTLKAITAYGEEVITPYYPELASWKILIKPVIVFTFMILLTSKITGKSVRPLAESQPSPRVIFLGYLCLFFFVPLSTFISTSLFSPDRTFTAYAELSNHPIKAFVAAVILAPLGEEIFCRRLLQDYLQDYLYGGVAIAISTIFFACLHADPYHITSSLGFGFLVSYIYYRTKNIIHTISIHAIANSVGWYFNMSANAEPIVKAAGNDETVFYSVTTFLLLLTLAYVGWYVLQLVLRNYPVKSMPTLPIFSERVAKSTAYDARE